MAGKRKSDVDTRHVGFRIPVTHFAKINELCSSRNMKLTEFFLALVDSRLKLEEYLEKTTEETTEETSGTNT